MNPERDAASCGSIGLATGTAATPPGHMNSIGSPPQVPLTLSGVTSGVLRRRPILAVTGTAALPAGPATLSGRESHAMKLLLDAGRWNASSWLKPSCVTASLAGVSEKMSRSA